METTGTDYTSWSSEKLVGRVTQLEHQLKELNAKYVHREMVFEMLIAIEICGASDSTSSAQGEERTSKPQIRPITILDASDCAEIRILGPKI
jgi:hypothetical protein